jgi:hypothetical protein
MAANMIYRSFSRNFSHVNTFNICYMELVAN